MPRIKKKFPCGHRGFGKYCHRCDDQKKAQASDLAQALMTPRSKKKKKKKKR